MLMSFSGIWVMGASIYQTEYIKLYATLYIFQLLVPLSYISSAYDSRLSCIRVRFMVTTYIFKLLMLITDRVVLGLALWLPHISSNYWCQ